MQMLPYIVAYASILTFIIAVVARFRMWAKMPIHVRWELYPVAHEGKKASYGGSYLEESEWWTKPREVSLMGELKAMIPEILFLVALKEHNPKMWLRSFPFHFGLYLVAGCAALMFLNGILTAISTEIVAGGFGAFLSYAIQFCGAVGICLALLGAVGLLLRRLTDPDLKGFTTSGDIFNLVFFVIAFGFALFNFILVDRDFSMATAFCHSLVTFSFKPVFTGSGLEAFLPVAAVLLLGLLVAYIPLTHMSHFVGKYFAYHAIRWNDTPNLRGGKEEAAINKMLTRPVTWSAPHIKGDGKKSWADVATEDFSK